MSRFILLYKGPATDMDKLTKEQGEQIMNGWKEWMANVGTALVDVGQPMGKGRSVVDDGSDGAPLQLSGYSIIEAEDIERALILVDGHPFLSDKTGEFSIEVFQLYPAPFEA